MTVHMWIVAIAAFVFTLVFATAFPYMMLCAVPGSLLAHTAAWTWVVSGFAAVALLLYFNRLNGTYVLRRAFPQR